MTAAPRVSIVVPTRNGAATLPALLDALSAQQTDWPFEVIAVDSSSTDGTDQLLRERVDRVVTIDARDFDHGLTRNLGIAHAAGEFVVLIVQDALPASDGWLDALVAPLIGDERIAGAFARQQTDAGASAITRCYLGRWAAASTVARTVALSGRAEFDALEPLARLERCAFDNVCSCIRRSVWAEHPFSSTSIAEDVEWAREVLLAGHRLAFAPDALVYHSHDRTARYEFRRTSLLHARLYELFGIETIPTLSRLARAIASSLALHVRLEAGDAGAGASLPRYARAIGLAFAWPLGQYRGAQLARRHAARRRAANTTAVSETS
jgi:rhamnosyltransferase